VGRSHGRRGFTWIEVLAAIFVTGITALIFSACFPMAARSQEMVADQQQALGLIQHKIDQLRAIGWGRLTYTEMRDAGIIDSSPSSGTFRFTQTDGVVAIYQNGTGTISVSDFATNIRAVTVTVSWTGSAARQGNGSLSVTALIARL
jgi:prepilin-type N-terminal cleavage/methylation domain-containing protein